MLKKLRPLLLLYVGCVVGAFLASIALRHQVMEYENKRISAWTKELNDRLARTDHLEELDGESMRRIGFDETLSAELEVAYTPDLHDPRM